ncbi:MAG: hypothetical protein ACXVPQ_10370 [Bacteroidia bacterium]
MDLPDPSQFGRFAKRLGVSQKVLQQAILETGSLHIRTLRKHLVRKGILFSILFFRRYLKNILMKYSL